MGSLMAGWDSPVRDPKFVTYQRNSSLTKGEIEAYWRSKKKTEEEHLRAILTPSDGSQESTPHQKSERKPQRSSSLPLASTRESFKDVEIEASFEKLIKKNGWWTRSNSAFLNEPPVIATDGNTHKYASQFHIANFASPKPEARAGLSA